VTVSYAVLPGDCISSMKELPSGSVHCCVTSPPYFGLRDYGVDGQIGLEPTPKEYVAKLVAVFQEVRRVLRDDGTLWLNLGDSYARTGGTDKNISSTGKVGNTLKTLDMLPNRKQIAPDGLKEKDLIGIPWRVAFAMQTDGWYLRQDIIWAKPNPMPESVTDRCTKSHEYLFLLAKNGRYYFDADAISEPLVRPDEANRKTPARFGGADKYVEAKKQSRLHSGNEYIGTDSGTRNRRSVWTVATQPYSGAHFATFPPKLIEPCILAGCPEGGTVLDPFGGSGTTAMVAIRNRRNAVLCELNENYIAMIHERCKSVQMSLI
jgi:DNA modification methylase